MNQKASGLIIRLIDVVLILLFGFISISQIEKRSKVNLPLSSETKLSTPDTENLIRVSIYPYHEDKWGFLVENEMVLIETIQDLHRYLIDKMQFYETQIRIKIYSEATAPIKYTMQVADLCEHLKLNKSLIVKMKTKRSGFRTLSSHE